MLSEKLLSFNSLVFVNAGFPSGDPLVAWALEVPVLPAVELRAVLLREVQALPPQALVPPGTFREQVLLV